MQELRGWEQVIACKGVSVGRIYFSFFFLTYHICSVRGLCETKVSGNLASSPRKHLALEHI